MNDIIWIRPADYDPAVQRGSRIRPEPSLPEFVVLDRRTVVMMFSTGTKWEVKPFTQLTLVVVE